jgi:glycolate oxidase iron-sulfur subunit
MDIEERYDEISHCNRCGFCQVACPIFRATGHEAGVARGRVALLRALIEKRIDWTEELKEPLFNCLLCGACTANCFPGVATADLMVEARTEYLERVGREKLHRLLFNHLLPYPKRLRLAARAAGLSLKSGLSNVVGALGLLRAFGRDFPRAQKIVKRLPDRAFRDQVPPGVLEGRGELRIGYFVGCGMDALCPDAAQSTLGVLRTLGRTVEVLENCCCGLPAMTYGDLAATQVMAEKNLALLEQREFDVIVTDCSSCASFLKKYPTLFPEGDPRRKAAELQAGRIRDIVQLLPQAPPLPTVQPGETVIATYHDPCHAVRGQNISREPRDILRSLPGLEYRELPEADWCCGGAGSYAGYHYDLSLQVLDRKLDNLERTGATLLVTSCPACIIHLSFGVHRRGLPVRVCHIAEVVAACGAGEGAAVSEQPDTEASTCKDQADR